MLGDDRSPEQLQLRPAADHRRLWPARGDHRPRRARHRRARDGRGAPGSCCCAPTANAWPPCSRATRGCSYVLVFKNFGPAAGASIAHTHSQMIAMPVVPENVACRGGEQPRATIRKHHHCIFCALIDEALTFEATLYDRASGAIRRKINVGQYVVERGEKFIAIKPFASRYEWEVHILPLAHQQRFRRHAGRGPGRPRARAAAHHGAARCRDRRRPVQLLPALGAARRPARPTTPPATTGTWRSARAPRFPPASNWAPACSSTPSARRRPRSGCATHPSTQ
ncbi:MAG: hypothetical protein MZW92_78850 [Comamonadaceae bacterium]|nr:hypothetical protein [Comamonadaceae bacterium]